MSKNTATNTNNGTKNKKNHDNIQNSSEIRIDSGLPKYIQKKQAKGKISTKFRQIQIEYTNGEKGAVGSTYGKSDQIILSIDKHSHNEFNGKRNQHQVFTNTKSSRALQLDFEV